MCGIAGIVGKATEEDAARVAVMNAVMAHRGPNAHVVTSYDGAVLGHRRLSIIDLSDRARQPMETPDGRYTIVFNGEIYNYKELRDELRGAYEFRTDSDTEVLLAAYAKWGEACLEKLRGMFAFCIYDTKTHTAFFARDRFGQKPLFFAQENKRLLFASEVKALLAADVPAKPNFDTWARYLVSASYDDDEQSFFASVMQLKPGECAVWNAEHGLKRRRYYVLADRVPREPLKVSVEEAAQSVSKILVEAAMLHMRSDVPVGIALSGGLDSSALLACLDLAKQLHEGVRCFSFDFGGDLSERKWIEAAVAHHGLQSDIRSFTKEEFRASIQPLLWHLEGPIGGLANCALARVMDSARAHGVVVLQDGTGLDEAFAGYKNHHNLYVGLALERGGGEAAQAVRDYACIWNVDETTAREAGTCELERTRRGEHTAIDGTVLTRSDFLQKDFVAAHPGAAIPRTVAVDPLRDALIDYLQVRKIPRNTRMKDRLSMAYSIELRFPFLDHVLVEYALSLPPSYYFLYGRTKSILREALKGKMDETVRTAPKRSIQAPQGLWLRSEPMRSYIGDLIGSRSFSGRGIFDVEKVKKRYNEFCNGAYENSFFVWQWINIEEWFRMFIDQPIHQAITLPHYALTKR